MRIFHSVRFWALLLFLPLIGIACRPEGPTRISAPPAAPATPPVSSPTVIPPPATADFACPNDYFPLKTGFGIDYLTTRDGTPYASSMRVISIDGERATLRYTSTRGDGRFSDQHIRCAPDGGLISDTIADLSGSSSPIFNRSDVKAEFAEGVFLPREILPGTTWRAEYNIEIHTQDSGMRRARLGDLAGKLIVTRDAQDVEDVETEAGRFRAMRVKSVTHATLELPGGRANLRPVERTSTTIEWWAKEVGLVKIDVPAGDGVGELISEAKAIVRP